jgi:diacylglycerol kinase (ATP)
MIKNISSKKFSLKSRLKSLRFAFAGLWSLLKNEHNARIHLVAAILALTLGIILKINPFEWSLLIIVIGLVFLTELLNTAIENLADDVEPEWNEKIRNTKDYAAAAVLISAIISIIAGGLIFIPRLLDLL